MLFVAGCSSSDETTKNEEETAGDEIYVFDEVPVDESQPHDVVGKEIELDYVIQIGAFSSKQNADKFAAESTLILSEDVKVDYDEHLHLYLVTLREIFHSRMSATIRRNELWRYKEFSDAWLKEVK